MNNDMNNLQRALFPAVSESDRIVRVSGGWYGIDPAVLPVFFDDSDRGLCQIGDNQADWTSEQDLYFEIKDQLMELAMECNFCFVPLGMWPSLR